AAGLLTIESPISEEHRIRRAAEIVDEDMISTLPSVRSIVSASTDDVGDACVALPPTLVSAGQRAGLSRLRTDDWTSRCIRIQHVSARAIRHIDGPDWLRAAGIRHIPDLVRGVAVASQHVLAAAAVANADHLCATAA